MAFETRKICPKSFEKFPIEENISKSILLNYVLNMLESFENCNNYFTVASRFFHISDTFDSYDDDDDDDGTADEVERANVLTAPKTVLPEWAE